MLVSALFRWPYSISIHEWCPPFTVSHVTFLFICLPSLSLVVSSLFPWPCRISSVSQVCRCRPGRQMNRNAASPAEKGGHQSLVVSGLFRLPHPSLLVSALFRWPCLLLSSSLSPFFFVIVSTLSPFLLGLRSCLPSCGSLCPSCLPSFAFVSLLFPFVSLLVFLLVDHCVCLVSLLLSFVSLLVGHCVCLVFLVSLFFRSCLPSCGSLCPPYLPSVSFCRLS